MRRPGFDLRKLDKLLAILKGKQNHPALRRAYNQWGTRYLAETKRRFIENSKGGGEWKPLSKKYRRKRGDMSRAKIMVDTGTLLKALNVGNPGNLYQDLKFGKRVGFGGPSNHPSGRFTIADIARIHHTGRGKAPKRVILHRPSQKLVMQMIGDLKRAVNDIGDSL